MTSTDPTPASMGGPLSEAEQLRAENAKLLRKLELANKHRQHSIESRRKMERKLIGWREAAESAAKERDGARARVGVLEGQLATARAEATEWRKVAADQTRMERARADEARSVAGRLQERLTAATRTEGLGEEPDDV